MNKQETAQSVTQSTKVPYLATEADKKLDEALGLKPNDESGEPEWLAIFNKL